MLNILLVAMTMVLVVVDSGPQRQISCAECKHEMHHFGFKTLLILKTFWWPEVNILDRGHIHEKGDEIAQYLAENYCPTLENQHDCPHNLAHWYPHLLQVPRIQNLTIQAAMCWTARIWNLNRNHFSCRLW